MILQFFQDVCQLPKNEGPCDDKIEQYWYDKDKDECYTFDWGNSFLETIRGCPKTTLTKWGR